MKEREEIVVGSLVVLMLIVWLGYEFHNSPRFAGSAWGGALALAGGGLMLVPAVYVPIKRVKRIRKAVTRWMSMRTILAWHIYAGVAGPILVLLHTGHKFESTLGIVLTALTLIVVVSGFVGRYLLSRISRSMRESDATIKKLHTHQARASREIRAARDPSSAQRAESTGVLAVLRNVLFRAADGSSSADSPFTRAVVLSDTIAELEYSRRIQAAVKGAFQSWLKLHIVLSCTLYVLMGLHVWAAIHFGLRWFE